MAAFSMQTTTMLETVPKYPTQIRAVDSNHAPESKPQLPTKRKRETVCGLGSFNKPFVIKPCPESPYDKPAPFKPIRLIGRSQLPLTLLDTSPDDNFASNGLFSASIEILERPDGLQNKENTSPKVLIARYEVNKGLYAVERVQPRVYSLCKLARWLKEKDVAELWDPSNLERYPTFPQLEENKSDGATWWQHAVVETLPERCTKRARVSMLRPKPQISEPEPRIQDEEQENVPQDIPQMDTPMQELPEPAVEAPTPQQLLETLVQQYLDAVYMSKTSLAYFAKGPITRARTAFTSPEEGAPPTYELVTFLRSMLLSHKASDKKYQDRLPAVIKSLPPGIFSDEDLAEALPKPKKSKKKTKLNRDGMYPQEEHIVKRWWVSGITSPEAHGDETLEQRIRRRIGDLRVREALAQMMLMLEIIALEALSTYKGPPEDEQFTVAETGTQEESQAKPQKRKKKMDDTKLQLDLLLDKLCIWQSVDQDGILDFDAKANKQADPNDNTGKSGTSDRLQSFCVEVIIPFYVSRLPEQAVMINKKLGGPAHTSPPKRKAMKPPVTSRKSGEPKGPDAKKSRRSLGRVATDTATHSAKKRAAPSLTRSATDSNIMNGIKRETSEVPLSAIPFQRSPSKGARASMSQFKHLTGRQIDLSGPSAATAAKLKQKKRVEEEVKEAINALKKPNRGLAAGSYVDDLEKRGLGLSNTKSRKPTTTVRKVLKDVQVTATPHAARRTKNMVEQTPSRRGNNPFIREHSNDTPPAPSSGFCIPSSGVRQPSSFIPGTVQRPSTTRSLVVPSISETPSKPASSKTLAPRDVAPRVLFKTPTKPRFVSPPVADKLIASPSAIFATPTKPPSIASSPQITSTPPAILATPFQLAKAAAVSESPLPTSTKPAQEEVSIYDALGWNDDDDLL